MVPKRLKHILFTICLLFIAILMLNLFLSKNLAQYLKKELSARTAQVTDGFYRLSFEKLSISFFKGELKIQGVELYPDPEVFRRWELQDSLPPVYVRTKIKSIEFGGVNLTWRWNFRALHFDAFRIESPEVNLQASLNTDWSEIHTKYLHPKTLYELISPYINTLRVKELVLKNASISYTVLNNTPPSVYALKHFDFHAYGFLLDKFSSRNGKLLYCDNFDFSVAEPQIIVSNNLFSLQTGNIKLDTRDSVVLIDNIRLLPQKELWAKRNYCPGHYLDGYIQNIFVQGVYFKREKGKSYLYARTFDIDSSEISLFDIRRLEKEWTRGIQYGSNSTNPDSFGEVPSIYEIISPVLYRVAIDRINIDRTKLNYTINSSEGNDFYKVDNLQMQTDEFLVAPINKDRSIEHYFRRFIIEATGIRGNVRSRNQQIDLKRMTANTERGVVLFEEIEVTPLSDDRLRNSISGKIDSLSLYGISYDSIIVADRFTMSSPDILFAKKQSFPSMANMSAKHFLKRKDILAFVPAYLPSFVINKMFVKNGRLRVLDKKAGDSLCYFSDQMYFTASNVIYKRVKGKYELLPLYFKTWQFDFANLDNRSLEKEYRLCIRKGTVSSDKGAVLQDVRFLSGENTLKQIQVYSPFLKVIGTVPSDFFSSIRISSIQSDSFQLKYMNTKTHEEICILTDTMDMKHILRNKETVSFKTIRFVRPELQIIRSENTLSPKSLKISSDFSSQALSVFFDKLCMDTFQLDNAAIQYMQVQENGERQVFRQDSIDLKMEGIRICNSENHLSLSGIHFTTRHVHIPLDKGFYVLKIESVDWNTEALRFQKIHLVSPYSMMEFAYKQPRHKDWFDVQVGSLSFSGIDFLRYLSEKSLHIRSVKINDVLLQNFKNKQIEVPKRIIPMIYSELQKAPFKMAIDTLLINNMSVVYQELDQGRTSPGKLFFTGMNGRFSGFTNVVTSPLQYITLNVDGKLMGKGKFKAVWLLPVDSVNNRFRLSTTLDHFELPDLNEIITPLTYARILSGQANNVRFEIDASDTSGNVHLIFPYENLKIELLKDKNNDSSENVFVSQIANWVIRQNNPREKDFLPYTVDMHIERDPYHSTFNYLWQMLRPALAESVGITKIEQEIVTESMHIIQKIKRFLGIKKKNPKKDRSNR